MPIVATAGHVDHGKSTLVEALTGRDPDRWAEEKERGLTIDLGFAWTDIEGTDVGFVDVPGHERFIKNMLAGVGAVDCALLVVAADSGWMPQTEEHAAVLNLLDTPRGVIALTRTDLVDADTAELATLEIMEEIEGTAMAAWPVIPVSAVTGAGLEELRHQLADRITLETDTDRPVRMWIDRSFSIRGAGLVVTGSVTQGTIDVGDELEVLPEGTRCRVRGLQRHDETVESVTAGDRAAINLVTDDSTKIGRGDLLTTPDSVGTTTRLIVTMRPSRTFDEVPKRGAFHMHIGTSDVGVSIRRIAHTDGFDVVATHAIPAAMGDRFIMRDSGRRAVVGGGRVLDPHPARRPDSAAVEMLEGFIDEPPESRASALLSVRAVAATDGLRLDSAGGVARSGIVAGSMSISPAEAERVGTEMQAVVGRYHIDYPLRAGIGRGELASRLRVRDETVVAVAEFDRSFAVVEGAISLEGFSHSMSDSDEARWSTVRDELEASFAVPRMSAIDLTEELLHALVRRGDLLQIDDDLAFTEDQVSQIRDTARALPDGFTVSMFKDRLGMTRRQAVPTLEWLDRTGVTARSGDGRVAR